MKLLVEEQMDFLGNRRREMPLYCPLCGRPLEGWRWFSIDQSSYYPSLVCWAGKPRWMVGLLRRMSVITPAGAHYQFSMECRKVEASELPFDRRTGEPLR